MDLANLLRKALPWIGAAATGNVPLLVGMAAKEVGAALGVAVEPKGDAIAEAVAGATPEQLAALRDREMTFKERMTGLGFEHAEEMGRLELETDKVYVGDTAQARAQFKSDRGVFWLGIAALATFLLDVIATFALAYAILTGGITVKDVGMVAAMFGMLGTLNGYVAANAQQVLSFYFGSSRGSQQKSDAMAEAIKALPNRV